MRKPLIPIMILSLNKHRLQLQPRLPRCGCQRATERTVWPPFASTVERVWQTSFVRYSSSMISMKSMQVLPIIQHSSSYNANHRLEMPCWLLRSVCELWPILVILSLTGSLSRSATRLHLSDKLLLVLLCTHAAARRSSAEIGLTQQESTTNQTVDQTLVCTQERRSFVVPIVSCKRFP